MNGGEKKDCSLHLVEDDGVKVLVEPANLHSEGSRETE